MALSETSTYLLATTPVAGIDPANSRRLAVGTGLTVQDTGPQGTFTILPTKMLGSLETLDTVGYLVRTTGDEAVTRRLKNNDGTISVFDEIGANGDTVFSVIPSTSVQLSNYSFNSTLVGTRSNLNFKAGPGIGITMTDTSTGVDVLLSADASGSGLEYVTNPFAGRFSTAGLEVTDIAQNASFLGSMSVNGQIHAGGTILMNDGNSLKTNIIATTSPILNASLIKDAAGLSIGQNCNNIVIGSAQTTGTIAIGSATSTNTFPGNVVINGTLTANSTSTYARWAMADVNPPSGDTNLIQSSPANIVSAGDVNISSGGKFTYTGSAPKTFLVKYNFVFLSQGAAPSGGSSFAITVNGAALPSNNTSVGLLSTITDITLQPVCIVDIITLNPNDTIDLIGQIGVNVTSTVQNIFVSVNSL